MIEHKVDNFPLIANTSPSKNLKKSGYIITKTNSNRDNFENEFRNVLERKQQGIDEKFSSKARDSVRKHSKTNTLIKESKDLDLETDENTATNNEFPNIKKLLEQIPLLENIIQNLEDKNMDQDKLDQILNNLLEFINNNNSQLESTSFYDVLTDIKDLINGTQSEEPFNLTNKLIPILKSLDKELKNSRDNLENIKQIQSVNVEELKGLANLHQTSNNSSDSSNEEIIPKINLSTNPEFDTSQNNEEPSSKDDSKTGTDKENIISLFVKEDKVDGKDFSLDQQSDVITDVKTFQLEDLRTKNIFDGNKSLSQGNQKLNENIFSQIYESAKITLNDDTSEMLIKLKPDNLGNVSLKLVIERGMVIAKFDVENQIVKQALESNLEDLRSSLGDKGFEIKEFNVSVNKESKQFQNFFGKSKKGKSRNSGSMSKNMVEKISENVYLRNHITLENTSKSINFLA